MVFNLQTHRNLIFITLFIITSCASKQKINFNNQNEVKVIFEKPTENYQVIAFWKPSYIKNNFIIGKAILTFKNLKVNKTFNITNKYFGIHKSQLPFHFNIDSSRFIINNSNIRLKYNKVDTTSLFSNTLNPFLFKDLNLDNKKELILVYTGSGQRHVSEFKPYSISLSNKFITAKSIKIPPFDKLDEMSVLSPDKRTITIHESNGSCKGIDKFFIFNPYNKDTPFVYSYLTKEVAFNHSTGKCITKTFKIK